MVETIPKAVRDVWDKWNIRGLVIFSLVLQATLVLLSPNRKRTPRRLFRLLLWSAYLLANWAADYAVGQISDSSGDAPEPNEPLKTNDLLAFWATFLLLHLGGPDTITALALEDNEFWLRSLFGLVCQFVATLYVFLLSIPNIKTKVDILHTWIGAGFRCIAVGCLFASLYIFRTSRKDGYDGFDVGLTYALIFGGIALDFISILIFCVSDWTFARLRKPKEELDKKDTRFDRFLNWLLGFRELKWKKCKCHEQEQLCHTVLDRLFIFRRWSEQIYSYNLIGSSLRIKPKRIHPTRGYISHAIIRSLYIDLATDIIIRGTVSVSKALNRIRKKIDLYIISRFIKHRVIYYVLYLVRLFLRFWFGIPLINYLFGIQDQLNEMIFTSSQHLTRELWEFIFEEVKRRSVFVVGMESGSHIYSARGDWILRDMEIEINNKKLLPYVTEVDYDQSILVWHIATELLQHTTHTTLSYYNVRCKELSKTLSEYMMYLLIVQPSLMSTVAGIDKLRFRDAIAEAKSLQEAKKLFQRTHVADSRDAKDACGEILIYSVEQRNENIRGYRSKSVLFQASMLAKELRQDENKMWEVVSKVWVEMLCYAATHCDSKQHAAQLNKDGELINFVWLLMAHFGLGEQFRTTKEDSRARLILDSSHV